MNAAAAAVAAPLLVDASQFILQGMAGALPAVVPGLDIGGSGVPTVQDIGEAIGTIAAPALSNLVFDVASPAWDVMTSLLASLLDGLNNFIETGDPAVLSSNVATAVSSLANSVAGPLGLSDEIVNQVSGAVAQGVSDFVSTGNVARLTDTSLAAFSSYINAIATPLGWSDEVVTSILHPIVDGLVRFSNTGNIEDATQALAGGVTSLVGAFGVPMESFAATIQDVLNNAANYISNLADQGVFESLYGQVWNAIYGLAAGIGGSMGPAGDSTVRTVEILSGVLGTAEGIVGGLQGAAYSLYSTGVAPEDRTPRVLSGTDIQGFEAAQAPSPAGGLGTGATTPSIPRATGGTGGMDTSAPPTMTTGGGGGAPIPQTPTISGTAGQPAPPSPGQQATGALGDVASAVGGAISGIPSAVGGAIQAIPSAAADVLGGAPSAAIDDLRKLLPPGLPQGWFSKILAGGVV